MEKINSHEKMPIDFTKIAKVIKNKRKKYYQVLPAVLLATYLFVCCIPRYYTSDIVLAPESNDLMSSVGLGSTLSSLGLGLGSFGKMGNNDAISPDLYPDLLSSNDFIVKMFPIKVTNKKKETYTYYEYLEKHIKHSWWEIIYGYIQELIKPTPVTNFNGTGKVDVFSLDKRQQDIAELIKKNISCEIDQKTYAIKISIDDQDPCVCATIADSTKKMLQEFIVDYRTSKARNDYDYYCKLYDESKADYDKARKRYAGFSDSNMDVNLTSIRSEIESLENEMQLKYNVFSTVSVQKQAALAKIQENTPAFTTIQNATMPIKPAGPKRLLISLGMSVLAFIVMTICFLRKEIC